MWTIWKEELYKIITRKIIWLGVFLLLAFVTTRLYEESSQYTTVIDGKIYQGKDAILRDKALTGRYAGVLTKELVAKVHREYGFFYYDPVSGKAANNYVSRLITENFTNFMQTEGDNPDEIHFREGADWTNNCTYLLENEIRFDYVYGWNDFVEMYILSMLALFVILILGLSPSFAEEYQLKTADLLRTTRHGKKNGIWMKILAGLCFAVFLTLLVCAYLWNLYLIVYGTQGLNASAVLVNFATPYGYCPESVLGFLLYVTALGVLGVVLLTGIVLGISASCRSPFLAVIFSIASFLLPVLWLNVLLPMQLLGITLSRCITHFMTSMPVYLPMSTGFAIPLEQIILHLGIALTVTAGGLCLGYFRYRNF